MSLFDDIKESAEGRELSTRWYQSKIASLGGNQMGAKQHIEGGDKTAGPNYGMMNLFSYRPETAEKLSYYDIFPLSIPVAKNRDGFTGINFHYLPIPLRIKLLDGLVDYSNNNNFDESTRLVVDYSKLKSLNIIKPTLHRYLAGQTKSQFRRIDADEFTVAALLPVQRFKKASAAEVWKDSRSMI